MADILTFLAERILTYKSMAAIGAVAAVGVGEWLAVRSRVQWFRLTLIVLVSIIGLYLGALIFGMCSLALYRRSVGLPSLSLVELNYRAGIVFYGGLIGFFGSLAWLIPLCVRHRRRCWDIVAANTPLFHGFARIGCYCAHKVVDGHYTWSPCCYGIQIDSPFFAHFWDSRLPTQLMEAVFNFALFAVLLRLLLRDMQDERGRWRGKIPLVYLIAYPVFRFVIEFFRGDAARSHIGPLSFSQVISLLILLGVGVYLLLLRCRVLRPVPPDPPYPPRRKPAAPASAAAEPPETPTEPAAAEAAIEGPAPAPVPPAPPAEPSDGTHDVPLP